MLTGPAGMFWFVFAAVFMPGVGLLVLASSRLARASRVDAPQLRGVAHKLGMACIAATGVLGLYLLPSLLDGPRAGGLGSMGDPLGAFLMLGYVFVLAPVALLATATIALLYAMRWRRARRSRAG
jgi:hypothetical protein